MPLDGKSNCDTEVALSFGEEETGKEIVITCGLLTDSETIPNEPFSWGHSRGSTTEPSASIAWVQIGRKVMGQEDLIAMFGQDVADLFTDKAIEEMEAA